MPFLDTNSRLLLDELLSAACSEGVEVFKRNKQVKYSIRTLTKVSQSPSLSSEADVSLLLLLWTCRCKWAGMFPYHSCGKLGAFSNDSQIQRLLSVSPSFCWLCGMRTTRSHWDPWYSPVCYCRVSWFWWEAVPKLLLSICTSQRDSFKFL